MDFKTAQYAIEKAMTAEGDFDSVQIEFFGGEPLLEFPFIRDTVDWFHTRQWSRAHMFMIGTNGTLFNEDIKQWLLKYKSCVNVGLSIDGNKTAHDLNRNNSYDIVRTNLPFIQEHWPHQPAKMTISAESIPFVADSIIELEEMGLNFTANIGFEDIWGTTEEKEELLRIYYEQLSKLVDFYKDRDDLYPVSPILESVPTYLGIPQDKRLNKKENVRFCGAGHEMIVVDVDGKTYPCHRFLPWVAGIEAPKEKVNCQEAWKPDTCKTCNLVESCPTCAGYNWEQNRDTGIRTTFHCQAFKMEVFASSKLEALKLERLLRKDIGSFSVEDLRQKRLRLEALYYLMEEGI